MTPDVVVTAESGFDQRWHRDVLGHYPTGVAVITAIGAHGEPLGMVVGSFTSVSMDPPLIAFMPARDSSSYARMADVTRFCVNVLSAAQEPLCRQFAAKSGDKFAGVQWVAGATGSPILEDCVAWIECSVDRVIEAGDHDIVLGRVIDMGVSNPTLPLVFFQGGYGRFSSLSSVMASETAFIPELPMVESLRPSIETLAAELKREVVVMVPVDDEIVAVASAGVEPDATSSVLGRRFPFVPPFGTLFIDGDEARRTSWLSRLSPFGPGSRAEDYAAALDRVCRRNWSVALVSTDHSEIDRLIEEFSRGPHTPAMERRLKGAIQALHAHYEPSDEALDADAAIRMLAVPVRDANGAVRAQLVVHGIAQPITNELLASTRAAMQEAASAISVPSR